MLCFFLLGGCKVSTPLSGPGYDSEKGVTVIGNDKLTIGLTYVYIGDDRELNKSFWTNVKKVTSYLETSPTGFIAYSIRKEIVGNQAWTMTVWESEESLNAFVRSDVHQKAITESRDALQKVGFVRFEIDKEEIPISWNKAETIMEAKGRFLLNKYTH